MEDVLKIDIVKVLFFLAPGTFLALSRSFALRGSFPTFTKDDLGALVIGSAVYNTILLALGARLAGPDDVAALPHLYRLTLLVALPALLGVLLGYVEANDVVGRGVRRFGVRLPSPHPTAWETLFRELEPNSILLLTLQSNAIVCGRWRDRSSSSTDVGTLDLYLDEIGSVTDAGYEPHQPRRGAYISKGEIRSIEVIRATPQNSTAGSHDQ